MIGTVLTDSKGEITSTPSLYQETDGVKTLSKKIRQDYAVGYEIQHRPFQEFNGLSVLGEQDKGQKVFNAWVEPPSVDPDETWRYNGRRPLARSKLIGIAAHATASLLIPNVFAQNDADEEDRDSAEVMRDLIEWNIENSNYEMSFLFGVISGLINPCIYMDVKFVEAMMKVKERHEDGTISTKEMLDEVLSGLKVNTRPVDEVMITNAYVFDVQMQRAIMPKRYIDFDEAFALYGSHPNFKHVRLGIKVFYNDGNETFYEQKDDNLGTLVEEVTYMNRREDVEVVYINGIYLGETNPEANLMKHRDYKDRPRYNLAHAIYQPIDEMRFHYGRSGASDLFEDDRILNTMWRMRMDVGMLMGMPPIGVSAEGAAITSKIMMPGNSLSLPSGSTYTPLTAGMRPDVLDGGIQMVERSMSESSQDNERSGIGSTGNKTAYEIQKIEQNAKIQLGLFGKMVANLAEQVGYLMMDDIIQHQTMAEVSELTSDETRMKFASFILPNKTVEGKTVSKHIKFNTAPSGDSFDILKQEGGMDANKRIYEVNPEAFRNIRFKLSINADDLKPKNDVLEKAIALEAYSYMIQNPFVDQEAVTKDFLLDIFARGKTDKYIKKADAMAQGMAQGQPGQTGQTGQTGPGGLQGVPLLASQMTGMNAAKSLTRLAAP